MIRPIGNATKQRLRAAIERMLAGQPLATDGRLTIVNLAIEAGVSRASANRAGAMLTKFRDAAAAAAVRRSPRAAPSNEDRHRRANANVLAQQIQARALLQRQEERHASHIAPDSVVPFKPNEKS
jgi:homoaconitase/3-isopropylmalate dehydratase large subunit